MVEDGLMLQYNVAVGDEIRIGSYTYRIAGRLKKVPGESASAGLLGARVYIPKEYLNQTRLLQRGSAATYKIYFRLPQGVKAEQLAKKLEPDFIRLRLDSETVEERKANLGRSLENAYDYLNLVAFIALLLGSIGVASSVHVYIKQKANTLAVLRCLGARSRATFAIYLIQTSTLGLIGAIGGVLLGLGVQYVLPRLMQDFIPVTIPFFISWASLAEAMVTGFGISLLFSLLPLLALRRVSPLLAIRASYEESTERRRDLWRWLVYALISDERGSLLYCAHAPLGSRDLVHAGSVGGAGSAGRRRAARSFFSQTGRERGRGATSGGKVLPTCIGPTTKRWCSCSPLGWARS